MDVLVCDCCSLPLSWSMDSSLMSLALDVMDGLNLDYDSDPKESNPSREKEKKVGKVDGREQHSCGGVKKREKFEFSHRPNPIKWILI